MPRIGTLQNKIERDAHEGHCGVEKGCRTTHRSPHRSLPSVLLLPSQGVGDNFFGERFCDVFELISIVEPVARRLHMLKGVQCPEKAGDSFQGDGGGVGVSFDR